MFIRPLFAAVMVVGVAAAVHAEEQSARVFKLRNVAAADAAQAVRSFAEQKKLAVTVAVEPVVNAVFVAAQGDSLKQATELLAKLDVAPPLIGTQFTVLQVPVGFGKRVGLGTGTRWTLTAREAQMFNAIIQMKGSGTKILAQPCLMNTDNQAARFHMGGQDSNSLSIQFTPRIMPDQTIRLDAEIELTEKSNQGSSQTRIAATESVTDGGTIVLSFPTTTKSADGEKLEFVVIMKADRVQPESR